MRRILQKLLVPGAVITLGIILFFGAWMLSKHEAVPEGILWKFALGCVLVGGIFIFYKYWVV